VQEIPQPKIPQLRIGEFSRASSLSVKTLRAYHEAGLLVPAEVDPATGYRSYSVAQLTDAAVIRRLRELDMPLEAVREVLVARDPALTAKVLSEHGAVLRDRLATVRRAIDELYLALAAPASHTPVHVRPEPARVVLSLTETVTEADWLGFLDRARPRLHAAASGAAAVVTGGFGACYPTLLDDDAQTVVAFVPVATPPLLDPRARADGVRVDDLAAADVAVLVHRGGYDDLAESYRQLGAWVATNAEPVELPVRELYVVGPAESDDAANWRTEICWPVRPA
jgi:DNA-binding transcriptional MerR regulator